MMLDGACLDGDGRLAGLARRVLETTGARSLAAYIHDCRADKQRMYWVSGQGIHPDVVADYIDGGVFKHDPFNAERIVGNPDQDPEQPILLEVADRRLQPSDAYLEFVEKYDLPAVGAAIWCMAPGLHLTLGVHGHGRGDIRSLPALEALTVLADALRAHFSARLLCFPPVRTLVDQFFAVTSVIDGKLRPADRALMALLAQGALNKQISASLDISETAVENRLRRLYRIFAVRNRTALLAVLGMTSH